MKRYTGIPSAQARIALWRARNLYEKSSQRSIRIGAKIAECIIRNAVSDRALEDMADMRLYLKLAPGTADALYLLKCVPPIAMHEALAKAA